MDNQTQDPVAQVEQPAEQPQPEQATQAAPTEVPTEATTQEQPAEPVKTPEQDFTDKYEALCAETGYELTFRIEPILDGDIYVVNKLRGIVSVAKKK